MLNPTLWPLRAMMEKDLKVQSDLLKLVYSEFAQEPHTILMIHGLPEKLGFAEKDIRYNARRLAEEDFIDLDHGDMIRPAAKGIEAVSEQGEKTFLDGDERYKILETIYNADRESDHGVYYDREELAKDTGIGQLLVDINVKYLTWKGLLETDLFMGGGYHTQITQSGQKAWEAYHERGVTFPGGHDTRSLRQRTIGPHERQKSTILFRDIAELTNKELVIIDRYARAPIFPMLAVVPKQARVSVLTTEKPIDKNYKQALQQAGLACAVEVRYLPDDPKIWHFHDRYVIRDEETGWTWGSSFHDSGEKQHTPTELRSVNVNKILADFRDAWQAAQVL